jgi:hypothetical protein
MSAKNIFEHGTFRNNQKGTFKNLFLHRLKSILVDFGRSKNEFLEIAGFFFRLLLIFNTSGKIAAFRIVL